MSCISCGRGLCDECTDPTEDACCCAGDNSDEEPGRLSVEAPVEVIKKLRTDVTESAGRKRAAALYPIDTDAACEWQMLSNCGGGFVPIVGCLSGRQRHIHHGPDKTTTSNDRSNISLICTTCHNRWHAKNDPLYGTEKCPEGISPKEPRPMTPKEMIDRARN